MHGRLSRQSSAIEHSSYIPNYNSNLGPSDTATRSFAFPIEYIELSHCKHGRRTKSRRQQALRREEVRRVHVSSPQTQPRRHGTNSTQREVLTSYRARPLKSCSLLEPVRRICFAERLAKGTGGCKQGDRDQARLGQGLGSQGNGAARRG